MIELHKPWASKGLEILHYNMALFNTIVCKNYQNISLQQGINKILDIKFTYDPGPCVMIRRKQTFQVWLNFFGIAAMNFNQAKLRSVCLSMSSLQRQPCVEQTFFPFRLTSKMFGKLHDP